MDINMKKLKVGDRVRFIGPSETYNGESGILYSYKGMSVGEHMWIFRFNFEWYDDIEVYQKEVELIYSKPEELNRCECGAHATRSFKNFHSDWCPMYKDMR
jgi:hypothetical protein